MTAIAVAIGLAFLVGGLVYRAAVCTRRYINERRRRATWPRSVVEQLNRTEPKV